MRFSLEDRSPLVEFEDLVHLTFEALAEVPDFRKPRGRQHDLKGVLALIERTCASGSTSKLAAEVDLGRLTKGLNSGAIPRARWERRPGLLPW